MLHQKNLGYPYGVCKVGKEKFSEIKEKPKYDYLITTDLYVVSSRSIKFIPRKKYLDMNEFIEILKEKHQDWLISNIKK